ncbi:hypothetical protein V5N11_016884 [Cardamine amara subsp. amara]|uniref:NYN domain-containing protein n=1 Tax=Cardamine amara subsp. amara TaxID=228776 RepID=A0ABD1BIP8_CARAN
MMKTRARTSVFWDIKTYPVPRGCDAGLVGWCINRYLKRLGYCGPLSIIAVGLLTDVPDGLLRKLSSTGIVLNHVPLGSIGILRSMDAWKQDHPAPANMMLISSDESILPRIRHSSGYNIRRLFPNYSTKTWKRFLLQDSGEWTGTAKSPAYWLCSLCNNDVCPGFQNFTTHLSSEEHADEAIRIAVETVASTWVLWDINSCPVPPDCDPRRVRPLIKQYLDDFGYSGSFTITATGLLTDVPHDVLRALSSTGVDLRHISFSSGNILNDMYNWTGMNPRPATLLSIVPYLEILSPMYVGNQRKLGCNVIELFPYNSPYSESLWKKFLLEDSGTLEEEDKCSETGEHASWHCSEFHDIIGKGFDTFISHLASPDHKPEEVIKHPRLVVSIRFVIV